MTKQQAKERAAARKQVAGQSTLDRFLSPSQEKQVQKQLAKASNVAAAKLKNSHLLEQGKRISKEAVTAVVKKQKSAGVVQLQAGAKRPLRQMKRLYPEDESVQPVVLDISQSPNSKARSQAGLSKDDDVDFQPPKRLKARAQAGSRALQTGKVSKSKVIKDSQRAQDHPAISLQSFSYSKEHSKKSKGQVTCSSELRDNVSDEVSSAQPAFRTRSKTTYSGMY